MKKGKILFFHPAGLFYGGSEKLLQMIAKYAAAEFEVYFAYSPSLGEQQKYFFEGSGVKLVPFLFKKRQATEPFRLVGMEPSLSSLINTYQIDCALVPVFARYQFPVNCIPASIPLVLTSPFGHFCTNGNVKKVFVSGKQNTERLRAKGVSQAELIYDPIEDFPAHCLTRSQEIKTIVFGRIGRADDRIFDPVSIKAFARLEKKYPGRVKYKIVSPPPAMKKLAADLKITNIEYLERDFTPDSLGEYFQSIDVFAHARVDGETFGRAIAEAMLSGLPVVTHRSHYNNEHLNFLDSSFARWSDPDDEEGYFQNLEWFVTHSDQIRPMGQLARIKALKLFDPKVTMPKILSVLEEACSASRNHSKIGRVSGYVRLWLENCKMIPYVLARRVLHIFPRVESEIINQLHKRRVSN
jgi:glycosyltransferase involved in cell wall biosynthesis